MTRVHRFHDKFSISSIFVNNLIDLTTKNTEEAEKKKREARKATAIAEKIASIFSIGVNTASAIIRFLADPGGYPGIGLSIGAGVQGTLAAAAVHKTIKN